MEGIIHKTSLCWHIITDDFYDERFINNGVPIVKYQWNHLNESMIGEKINFEIENIEFNIEHENIKSYVAIII